MNFFKKYSPLGFIKGGKNETKELQKLTETAWMLAYTLLWNDQVFSSNEKETAKKFIKEWIVGSLPDMRKSYMQIAQRIILVAKHRKTMGKNFPRIPSIWFNPENPAGFGYTREWLEIIDEVRLSLPHYKKHLKALAEAVLEYSECSCMKNYSYWRDYFIDRRKPGLLKLFTLYCSNQKMKLN